MGSPDTVPVGSIITYGDVPECDWDRMRELACFAQPGLYIGRVTINYEGHSYKTSNRHGELRFRRIS